MLATLAATFVAGIGIGHIDRHGNVPESTGVRVESHQLSMSLPPRTTVYMTDRCQWLENPRVAINVNSDSLALPAARWIEDHSVERFGSVTFNGVAFSNFSYHSWAAVAARIFDGCKYSH